MINMSLLTHSCLDLGTSRVGRVRGGALYCICLCKLCNLWPREEKNEINKLMNESITTELPSTSPGCSSVGMETTHTWLPHFSSHGNGTTKRGVATETEEWGEKKVKTAGRRWRKKQKQKNSPDRSSYALHMFVFNRKINKICPELKWTNQSNKKVQLTLWKNRQHVHTNVCTISHFKLVHVDYH